MAGIVNDLFYFSQKKYFKFCKETSRPLWVLGARFCQLKDDCSALERYSQALLHATDLLRSCISEMGKKKEFHFPESYKRNETKCSKLVSLK